MEKDVVCQHCGLINDFRTIMKNGQKTAWCRGCDSFIKNIPYAPPMFYFGKYKGTKISECTDIQYLYWGLKKGLFKGGIKTAVEQRVEELDGGE